MSHAEQLRQRLAAKQQQKNIQTQNNTQNQIGKIAESSVQKVQAHQHYSNGPVITTSINSSISNEQSGVTRQMMVRPRPEDDLNGKDDDIKNIKNENNFDKNNTFQHDNRLLNDHQIQPTKRPKIENTQNDPHHTHNDSNNQNIPQNDNNNFYQQNNQNNSNFFSPHHFHSNTDRKSVV